MSSFSILVDTNTDLLQEYIDEHGIMYIPIAFIVDGVTHNKGNWEEISAVDYYNALRKGSEAGTMLANLESFVEIFTDFAKQGKSLVTITLSSGLSGTYQNGAAALMEVKSIYPDCDIHVIDSINAAGGAGVLASLAVDKRAEGLSASETAAFLEEKKHSVLALFTVDDLMHLHRGGRLSKVQAIAGSLIGIKPMLNVAPDGTLKLKDRVRGRKTSITTLFEQMKRTLDPNKKLGKVIISHSDCEADAETLAEMIRKAYNAPHVIVAMMGPIIGTHVGPGAVALFFESDMTRNEYEKKFYPNS